jgi:hypothetical protein
MNHPMNREPLAIEVLAGIHRRRVSVDDHAEFRRSLQRPQDDDDLLDTPHVDEFVASLRHAEPEDDAPPRRCKTKHRRQ